MATKTLKLILICLSLIAVCARAEAQSKRAGVASLSTIQSRIIQLEDERNLNGDELTGLLKHASPVVRERAALAIGRIGDKRGAEALIAAMQKDGDQSVRAMAAFALGEMEDAQAAAPLLDAVNSPKEPLGVRARAIEALGKIGSIQANAEKLGQTTLDSISQSLVGHLPAADAALSADQKLVASLAITALMRLRNPASVEPLARQLKSKDAEIRAQAANALARLRQPIEGAVPALIEALNDGDADVRANAARALGVSKDSRAVEPLLKTLQDKSEHAQVNAVRALAVIGDRRAIEPLIELAKLSDPKAMLHRQRPPSLNLTLECVVALGTLKDERALPFLRQLGEVEGVSSHPEIALALARLGESDIIFSIEKDATWDDPERRFRNLTPALAELGTEQAKEILLLLLGLESRRRNITSQIAPDALRALARLKIKTLPIILRSAIMDDDVIARATAASLMVDSPGAENLWALIRALKRTERDEANDAKLAILTALSKHKAPEAIEAIKIALVDKDHLVRRRAVDLLKQTGAGDFSDRIGVVQTGHDKLFYQRVAARMNKKVTTTIYTDKGVIKLELFAQDAPITVDSFITLARKGFFNNLTFHRVVPNFVIQGGDPRGDGEGGPGYQIRCEINTRPYARGAVGMALSGKDTGGSQFFITHSPQPHLDGGYTVFGQVTSGMDVVDRIARGDAIRKIVVFESR